MKKHCWSQVLQSEDENYLVTYSQFEETKKPYEHKNKKVNLIQKTSTKTERVHHTFPLSKCLNNINLLKLGFLFTSSTPST